MKKYIIKETTTETMYVMSPSLEPADIGGTTMYGDMQMEEHFAGREPHQFTQEEAFKYCYGLIDLENVEGFAVDTETYGLNSPATDGVLARISCGVGYASTNLTIEEVK